MDNNLNEAGNDAIGLLIKQLLKGKATYVISNALKCFDVPEKALCYNNCLELLKNEVELFQPKKIVLFGNVTAKVSNYLQSLNFLKYDNPYKYDKKSKEKIENFILSIVE